MSDNVAKNGLRQRRSIFLPLLLVVITVLGNFVNDIAQGLQRRAALAERLVVLEQSVADAQKVRSQFDTLVKGLAALANSGNANAATIMAQLAKAGVKVGAVQ